MSVKKPILVRDYDFSDAMLEQLSDCTASNITRDISALSSRGVTAATVIHLNSLQKALSDTPTDIEARSMVGEAVEIKDAAYIATIIQARRLRTAAQNTFGEDSPKYRRFDFDKMDKLKDLEFQRALKRFYRVGTTLQPLMVSEGIDANFLTGFLNTIEAYANALDDVSIAEEARDAQTENRVTNGNILYKEVVRLCNIGKDVFAPISEATYNDYVIENFVGSSNLPATSIVIKGAVTFGLGTPVEDAVVSVQGANPPAFTDDTSEDGKYRFRFNNLQPGDITTATLTVTAQGFEVYSQPITPVLGEVNVYNITLTQALQIAA